MPPFLLLLSMLSSASLLAKAAFPTDPFHSVWDDKPAGTGNWTTDYYMVGNGPMGMAVSSNTTRDELALNLDTLWVGGPFSSFDNYTGGNPSSALPHSVIQGVRDGIFSIGNGSVEELQYSIFGYGSYSSPGSFLIEREGGSTEVSGYRRWLDMKEGVVGSEWHEGAYDLERWYFCSFPTNSCHVRTLQSPSKTARPSSPLPASTHSFFTLRPGNTTSVACHDSTTLSYTSVADALYTETSMGFTVLAYLSLPQGGSSSCSTNESGEAAIVVEGDAREMIWTFVGTTEYDIEKGGHEDGFSFGSGPKEERKDTVGEAWSMLEVVMDAGGVDDVLAMHAEDWKELYDAYEIRLGGEMEMGERTTAERIGNYSWEKGDPVLENAVANFGRYLLISSARGTLPANLQGVWSYYTPYLSSDNSTTLYSTEAPWGADYHLNINLQENYWMAEPTGLGAIKRTLFDLIEKTLIPRGRESASILYGTEGWVSHGLANAFGWTGMNGDYETAAEWSDFQVAAAWILSEAFDRYSYGLDVEFWKERGYPMVKEHAQYWLANLVPDTYTNDGTLVAVPCNSPEQPMSPFDVNGTFACSVFQQFITNVFNYVLIGAEDAGETDYAFLEDMKEKQSKLDRGAHIGRWGQLQEYKLDLDVRNDTHRHISHLIGMYPTSSLATWNETSLARDEIYEAVGTSLYARGNGSADSNTGWGKMHRSGVAGVLGNGSYAFDLYKYAIDVNFGSNLLSNFGVFQIDANLAAPAVILNLFLQSPLPISSHPSPLSTQIQTIKLLPAPPPSIPSGYIKGARARGGFVVDLVWEGGKLVEGSKVVWNGGEGGGEKSGRTRIVVGGVGAEEGEVVWEGEMGKGESWSV